MGSRIGFIGTRFAGTDGVSLESAKWAEVLWDHRHVSYWYGGKLDRSPDISMHVPHAHFGHPDIEWINDRVFGVSTRSPEVTRRIFAISDFLKGTLYEFTRKFDIDLLIAENCLTIPMNIPLGIALTHFIAETGFPTIAHHHDFYWERDRFSVNAVDDMLSTAFPGLVAVHPARHDQLVCPTGSVPSARRLVGAGPQRAELRRTTDRAGRVRVGLPQGYRPGTG